MISKKIGKRNFAVFIGKVSNDSYSATIKKLALAQQKHFVQIVPARLCAGFKHAEAALEHAFSALDSGAAFSKKPELEFLIRFFGEKQLHKALEKARFGPGEALVFVVEATNKKDVDRAKNAIGFVEDKQCIVWKRGENKNDIMKEFGIGENELDVFLDMENALEELVIERVSMVALEK